MKSASYNLSITSSHWQHVEQAVHLAHVSRFFVNLDFGVIDSKMIDLMEIAIFHPVSPTFVDSVFLVRHLRFHRLKINGDFFSYTSTKTSKLKHDGYFYCFFLTMLKTNEPRLNLADVKKSRHSDGRQYNFSRLYFYYCPWNGLKSINTVAAIVCYCRVHVCFIFCTSFFISK